ncbi:MAG: hypothetical protein HY040_10360 [Planctomycetes bacterium]|nr:hypothetical protein [Planctomycetota bacterium]
MAESRVKRSPAGDAIVTLDEATHARIGLAVEPMRVAELKPEAKGYGRVLDVAPLVVLVTELAAAQTAADASRQEFERLRVLQTQNNTSARALQAAEATARRDEIQIESVRLRLVAGWGPVLAERKDLLEFARALTARESALVRVDLPAGETVDGTPTGARLVTLSSAERSITAQFVSATPAVDSQTQGVGFLFLVKPNAARLSPGAAVTAYLPSMGATRTGVLVPHRAIVRADGKAWAYVQIGDGQFTRKEVPLTQSLEGGWFASTAFAPTDRVVVSGAQTLLSEELKAGIRMRE